MTDYERELALRTAIALDLPVVKVVRMTVNDIVNALLEVIEKNSEMYDN